MVRSSTVRAAEGVDTGAETGIIGGKAETTDRREGMGVVVEAIGIHLTSHTPKTDRGAGKTQIGTEAGWCEREFFWGKEMGHDGLMVRIRARGVSGQ